MRVFTFQSEKVLTHLSRQLVYQKDGIQCIAAVNGRGMCLQSFVEDYDSYVFSDGASLLLELEIPESAISSMVVGAENVTEGFMRRLNNFICDGEYGDVFVSVNELQLDWVVCYRYQGVKDGWITRVMQGNMHPVWTGNIAVKGGQLINADNGKYVWQYDEFLGSGHCSDFLLSHALKGVMDTKTAVSVKNQLFQTTGDEIYTKIKSSGKLTLRDWGIC